VSSFFLSWILSTVWMYEKMHIPGSYRLCQNPALYQFCQQALHSVVFHWNHLCHTTALLLQWHARDSKKWQTVFFPQNWSTWDLMILAFITFSCFMHKRCSHIILLCATIPGYIHKSYQKLLRKTMNILARKITFPWADNLMQFLCKCP
jgi:hypothetical protein